MGRTAAQAKRQKAGSVAQGRPRFLGATLKTTRTRAGVSRYYGTLEIAGVQYVPGEDIVLRAAEEDRAGKKRRRTPERSDWWVGRIVEMWADVYEDKWVSVKWWYRPSDVHKAPANTHAAEVFASDHVDENYVTTIDGKASILSYDEFKAQQTEAKRARRDGAGGAGAADGGDDGKSAGDKDVFDPRKPVYFVRRFYDTRTRQYRPYYRPVRKAASARGGAGGDGGSGPGGADEAGSVKASAEGQDGGSDVGGGEDDGGDASEEGGSEDEPSDDASSDAESDVSLPSDGRSGAGAGAGKGGSSRELALQKACTKLQLSAVPSQLPCREVERKRVMEFVESAIVKGGLGCACYISGMPGMGKTATVHEVLRKLKKKREQKLIPYFKHVEINAMKLSSAYESYTLLWRALTGETVSPKRAQQLLNERFSTPSSRRACTVLVLDELDYLATIQQTVLYNFFEWPMRPHSRLVVIGIANTMDLPERLMPKVKSRLGLVRIVFSAYDRSEIEQIVKSRLDKLHGAFHADAIKMAASKVAKISGDARRALQICHRAAEIALASAEDGGPVNPVAIETINAAAAELLSNHQISAIAEAPPYEKAFMAAVYMQLRATGVGDTPFDRVFTRFEGICRTKLHDSPSRTEALTVCNRLGDVGLLDVEAVRDERYPVVGLTVQEDDIKVALSDDPHLASLFD